MKYIFNIILLTISLISCVNIENLKRSEPKGNDFQKYLAKYYLEFADAEAKQYDWIDSEHFAEKAKWLIYGYNVRSEDPKNWKIAKTFLPELNKARDQLDLIINEYNIINHPSILAYTQFSFDCWVEQQEENWQFSQIDECRDNFYNGLNEINNVNRKTESIEIEKIDDHKKQISHINIKGSDIKQKLSDNKKSKNNRIKKINLTQDDYRIIFDGKKLTDKSKIKIKNILKFIEQNKNTEIIINSYSNKLENDDDNLRLSKERALTIKKILLKSKIKTSDIMIFAFGNSDIDDLNNRNQNKIELYIGE